MGPTATYLDKLQQWPLLLRIHAIAAEKGVLAYLVGGFVRDLLLKRPCKDVDIVCVGDTEALARSVAQALGMQDRLVVYKNFGVYMLPCQDMQLEFVGARKESYQRNSRNPRIAPASLLEDQKRRDFTINTLAIGLNTEDLGQLYDPLGGTADLAAGCIQTPADPKTTFSDDPLRMLRAVRFAQQLGFSLSAATQKAIQNTCHRLEIISKERIIEEFHKILLCPCPSIGIRSLDELGLLAFFFPELVELKGTVSIAGKSHKDNFYHTLEVVDNVAKMQGDLWLRWAALLHDIAKPKTKRFDPVLGFSFHGHEEVGARMVPKIFARLRLPMAEPMRRVAKLVRLHLRPIALVQDGVSDSAVRRLLHEAQEDTEDLMRLCRADITSKNPARVKRYLHNFELVERKMRDVEERDAIRNFQPVITGEYIMETFGVGPSRVVGTIKEAIKEAILEGTIRNTLEEATLYMLELGEKQGLKAPKVTK